MYLVTLAIVGYKQKLTKQSSAVLEQVELAIKSNSNRWWRSWFGWRSS